MTTHLLFDFFGTLVEYTSSRTEQGYPCTPRLLRDADAALDTQGAKSVGGRAFRVDPAREAPIPEEARLPSLFELERRLSSAVGESVDWLSDGRGPR